MGEDLLRQVYQHPLLKNTDFEKICGAHEMVSFSKGDFYLKLGEVAQSYLIVQKGLFRSSVYDYNGNDITTGFFSKYELVIEVASLFQRTPSQESIQALTDCECLALDFQKFQTLFHSIEGFSEWGRGWMSQSLFESKQRAVSMITESATDRYLKLLDHKPNILRDAPLKNIASYLGITDTSLSRIRKETAKL